MVQKFTNKNSLVGKIDDLAATPSPQAWVIFIEDTQFSMMNTAIVMPTLTPLENLRSFLFWHW